MHRNTSMIFGQSRTMLWCLMAYVLFAGYLFCLPANLFDRPLSTVLESSDGQMLSAQIARDEQWRLPPADTLPERFVQCLLQYEDKRFYCHPGFDPLAMIRAAWLNIKHRRIVSGGSTLTMQVIRLSRQNKQRTPSEKFVEILLATRLELKYSKREILRMYATHAPFGGNVVGLESASWRYFNKPASHLSWGEAATLAVLPNSPALIHPGKNREALRRKRDALLDVLFEKKIIDTHARKLAIAEPLPDAPARLPSYAPHLLAFLQKQGKSGRLKTTLNYNLQKQLNELAKAHWTHLRFKGIHNLAILVIDIQSNQVIAYVGNSPAAGPDHGQFVDVLQAPRSTGSILKPFLYAAALKSGKILPKALLTDIPLSIAGYKPENYSNSYDGVVPADKALSRSLNVPFVKLLQQYEVPRFYSNLKQVGLSTLHQPPDHYGLSLILGGAECTLWDITNAYAGLARSLYNYGPQSQNSKVPYPFTKATTLLEENPEPGSRQVRVQQLPFSPDAIHFTFKAMEEVVRPSVEGDWKRFEAGRRIAWKTGTSYGFRDAWAVGLDTKYAVGVWVGNADGEGKSDLIGVYAAAPLLFDVFKKLPAANHWFPAPYDELEEVIVCKESGFLANEHCPSDTVLSTRNAFRTPVCPFHKLLHLSADSKYRISQDCQGNQSIASRPWFILPPTEEYYYRKKHPEYQAPPPLHPGCTGSDLQSSNPLELIYPSFATILVPARELDGNYNNIILKASHRDANARVFWHLDNRYLGSTKNFHTFEIQPVPGLHEIVVVDEMGNVARRSVEIKLE